MSWKDELLSGNRSFEDFYNCTVGKQFTDGHPIDPLMIGIIKALNAEGVFTISCCEGHKPYRNATVAFSSKVTEQQVRQFMQDRLIPVEWFSLEVSTKPIYFNKPEEVFTVIRMDIKAYHKVELLERFKEAAQ